MPTTDMQTKLVEINKHVQTFMTSAKELMITNPQQMTEASEFIKQVVSRKKRIEELRLFFTKPLNDHIHQINAQFKQSSVPLIEIEEKIKRKMSIFRNLQARQIAEARRKEEERQRKEHEKEMERQRKEAEKEAEKERKALEKGEMSKKAKADELKRIEAEKQAKEAAIEREKEEFQPEVEMKQEKSVESESGSVRFRKDWDFKIIDESLIPRKYLKVDEVKIRKFVKAGEREIPGVKVFEREISSVY